MDISQIKSRSCQNKTCASKLFQHSDAMESQNEIESIIKEPRIEKEIKPHHPLLGSRIYPSHPETHKNPLSFTKLKARSSFDFENEEERKLRASSNIMDSCTQTSKTILELAELETGQLTPDSLMQSPRGHFSNKYPNLPEIATKLAEIENVEDAVFNKPSSILTYTRRNDLKQYLDDCVLEKKIMAERSVFPKKSLTETFLEKKQSDEASICHCRSRFLQQTNPLRNLPKDSVNKTENSNPLKSVSCVESYDPNFIQEDDAHVKTPKIPFQASRFTVKNVRELQITPKETFNAFNFPPADSLQQSNVGFESLEDDDYVTFRSKISNCSKQRTVSFMSPTHASEQKNQLHFVKKLNNLILPTRRGRSLSPYRNTPPVCNFVKQFAEEKIPYIDQSVSELKIDEDRPEENRTRESISRRKTSTKPLISPLVNISKFDEDLLKIDLESLNVGSSHRTMEGETQLSSCLSTLSSDNAISVTMNHIRSLDWNTALKGLAEMTELCRIMDQDMLYPHMTVVNQRLLELLRSPRSHVCRTACQAAGHFFESMKDTRRPEFDDIIEVLLYKTADANKFIRKDANLALDCMVTHIPIFHAVRSISLKGPTHKNPLVRTATIRLIVCSVVIAGPSLVLNLPSHENTRKRIIHLLVKFLEDKHQETRKYGERLYKVFCREATFDAALRKYLEKDEITHMKNTLKKNEKK